MRKLSKLLSLLLALAMIIGIKQFNVAAVTAGSNSDPNAWLWPVLTSWRMSRGFSADHTAVDILPGSESSTPVLASKAGTVINVFNGCKNNNGAASGGVGCDTLGCPDTRYFEYGGKNFCNYGIGRGVIIDHGNGFVTQYAHMDSVSVSVGQSISKGQQLGYMGSRGASTGKHLHFEMRSGYTSGKSFWSCATYNNNPYGDEYIITGSWNGVDGVYYTRSAHTHSYGSWQTVTAATCTSAGSSKRVCSCGDTQTRTDAALGHSWDSGVIETAAECTSAGVKKYTCTRCKTTKTEAISASGHTLIEDKEIPATCTETGLTKGSHCSVCNAIVTKQQIIPALGHKEKIESINKTCTTVTANYKCTVCGATRTETKEGGIYSDWSEDKPSVENYKEKTVYSYRDKSTTYKDGTNTLDGWDYNGNSEPIYGSWTNGGWVKSKPTETDVLKITDTKTVKDSEAHGYILYYYYYPNSSAIFRFKDYGGNSGLYYLEVSSLSELTKSTDGPWYDGDARYDGYWNGTGVTWFFAVNDSSKYPKSAVTHTEWYYQTRTKTTRYYFDKWSDWSEWSDDVVLATDKKEVKTKTLYSFEILPAGHTLSNDWQSDGTGHWHICTECGEKVGTASHTFDNDKDTNCNVCGYVRIVKPEVSDTDTQVTVNSVKAKPGEEIIVTVSLKNAPNATSMTASDIVYDTTALTLKSAKWLSENSAMKSWNTNTQKGVIGYEKPTDLNGEALELTFIVSDTAAEGDYNIGLAYRMTVDGEIVDVPVIPGTITVKNYVSGDTNGDDRVTDQDAIYLLFHVYFEDEYPVNQPCDFNKDGNVTDQDAVYLLFHVYFEEEYPIG
ncbi:MAG: peptidoglycan DD-metalloendopeptidase family protein [Clostridia bacterium]|nr:peptidoglycan DD-metalloendopeptidase family protein [Clostridia bacterium]